MNIGKIIVIDADKCTGCRGCEMACSIKHFGVCSPYYSRIRILEFQEVKTFVPVICQSCQDALCLNVCPMNARLRQAGGLVITDGARCIGCRTCVCACPLGAAGIDPETGKAMSCDLCEDDGLGPWCVRACGIPGALKLVEANEAARVKSRDWARNLKEVHRVLKTITKGQSK